MRSVTRGVEIPAAGNTCIEPHCSWRSAVGKVCVEFIRKSFVWYKKRDGCKIWPVFHHEWKYYFSVRVYSYPRSAHFTPFTFARHSFMETVERISFVFYVYARCNFSHEGISFGGNNFLANLSNSIWFVGRAKVFCSDTAGFTCLMCISRRTHFTVEIFHAAIFKCSSLH